MARKNSIFNFFSNKFCFLIRRRQKLPKYKFLWKKLKNWIFPGQKTARKKRTFSQKSRPFLDGQEKSNFQFFATKICRSFENILNYPNINFCEKITGQRWHWRAGSERAVGRPQSPAFVTTGHMLRPQYYWPNRIVTTIRMMLHSTNASS